METVEAIVIGAGVIGLAAARRLAQAGCEVIVLEAEDAFGSGISSRNSEVIHAGIYYPQDSLKARLCVAGKAALYEFCESRAVAHDRCGKLIVATSDNELAALSDLEAKAAINGVHDLTRLEPDQAREMEPALHCRGALLSPSTGIVDGHGFMLALLGEIEAAGGALALNSPVCGGRIEDASIVIDVAGPTPLSLRCRILVNAAGLGAQSIAHGFGGLAPETIPALYYAKGNYFTLKAASPFSRLIYPVPETDALGVHVVLDLNGRAKFGPDIEWVEAPDYAVSLDHECAFYSSVRRYWPALPDNALEPGYAGVRPKLTPAGAGMTDFVIQDAETHGVSGLINLYGIESPGLTSSLAIADEIAKRLGFKKSGYFL